MMKTIFVVYSNQKKTLTEKQISLLKLYAFNTASEVKKGDIILTKKYTTPLHVVSVLDESHKYYSIETEQLSNSIISMFQKRILTLEIRNDNEEEIIFGRLIKLNLQQ